MQRRDRYEDHPHVITNRSRPHMQQHRMTPAEFAAQYFELSPVRCPPGSVVVVSIGDGPMRFIVEVPTVLIHNGCSRD